jgi:hypothetical protein
MNRFRVRVVGRYPAAGHRNYIMGVSPVGLPDRDETYPANDGRRRWDRRCCADAISTSAIVAMPSTMWSKTM